MRNGVEDTRYSLAGAPGEVSLVVGVVVSQSFRFGEGSSTSGHTYPASAANCAKPDCSDWSDLPGSGQNLVFKRPFLKRLVCRQGLRLL